MKKKPLVSVVMNCFNGEKFLNQAIESLKYQTYKNWELIFWDNKSNDNSKKIIKKFKDKRIKYFCSKKFQSLYKARNEAIKKTKGELISFLDTDDYWNKKFISIFLKKFRKEKAEIVFSKYYTYNEKKKKRKINANILLSKTVTTQNLLDKYIVGISAIMIKKKIFKKNKFNNKFNIIGDFDLFIKLSKNYNFYTINEPLLTYRIHDENFSIKNLKMYLDELNFWMRSNKLKLLKNMNIKKLKFLIFKLKIKLLLQKISLSFNCKN